MKKLTLLLILLIGSLSYGQTIIYSNAPDRQKITEFEKRNDSIVISLQNSGTNKVYIGDIAPDISGKADLNSPTFTGSVVVPTATISDAAVNLGQLMDSLATVEVSNPIIWNESISETIGPDQNNNIFISDSTETVDKIFIIQNQANGEYTEDVGYTFITQGDGKIFVKGESGAGVDPVEVSTIGKAFALIRKGANTWIPFGTSEPWDPYGPELYNETNALAKINNANSTTGINNSNATLTVVQIDEPFGTYAVQATSTSVTASTRMFENLISLDEGSSYKYEYYARSVVGSDSDKTVGISPIEGGDVVNDRIYTSITDEWQLYSGTFKYIGGSNLSFGFYTNRTTESQLAGSVGDAIQATGLSVKKLLQ